MQARESKAENLKLEGYRARYEGIGTLDGRTTEGTMREEGVATVRHAGYSRE
jgi:hypothetical protein